MSCNNQGDSDDARTEYLTQVSEGGANASFDVNGLKALARYHRNRDLTNIANGAVRPTFGRIVGATPGGARYGPLGGIWKRGG